MHEPNNNNELHGVLDNSRQIAAILLFIFLIALFVGVLKGDLVETFLNGKTL